jgi:hypothetical protein
MLYCQQYFFCAAKTILSEMPRSLTKGISGLETETQAMTGKGETPRELQERRWKKMILQNIARFLHWKKTNEIEPFVNGKSSIGITFTLEIPAPVIELISDDMRQISKSTSHLVIPPPQHSKISR